jgi:hypothetical protein
VSLGLLATGCGGPRTEADRVQLALQSHLNGPTACQATTETVILPWEVRDTDQAPTAQRLRAMAAAELVKTRPTTVHYAKAQVPGTIFEPSGALITIKESSLPIFSNVRFCYARKQVSEILDAVPEGAAEATVRFNYVLGDAPKWTGDPGIQAAFPDIPRAMTAGGGAGQAKLTRSGDTWKVVEVS